MFGSPFLLPLYTPRQHSRKIGFPKGLCHQNGRCYCYCYCCLYPLNAECLALNWCKLGWIPSIFHVSIWNGKHFSRRNFLERLEGLKPLIWMSCFRKSVENQLNIEPKNQIKIKNTYSVMSDWDDILPGVSSDRDATFPACSVVKAYVLRSFWLKNEFSILITIR